MAQVIDEFRGTDNLVYAEVITDDNEVSGGYVTGVVKILAPVAEISKTVETASDVKYYDNKPALTINAEGADTITLTVPALDLATLADITGKTYDSTIGAFLDGERVPKYFALGYRLRLTDGTYRYVWRYKGSFGIPDETSQTENASTDSNNQQLTFTGIQTMHVFSATGTSQKALVVDQRDGIADLSNFFSTVTTCDTLTARTAYTLTITEASNTTLTVKRNGVTLANNASIYAGDVLTITVTGGTVKVNNTSFTSGNTYTVAGATTVVSTATSS